MENIPYDLIRKYLLGKTDPDEEKQLMEWLLESEDNRRVFFDTIPVVMATDVVNDKDFEKKRQDFLDRLWKRLEEEEASKAKRFRSRLGRMVILGVSIAAAVSLAFVMIPHGQSAGDSFEPRKTYTSYTNTSSDADMIMLPDGTQAWVKGGSTLHYGMTGPERVVTLKGEAFFDVAKDSIHPFVVRTSDLSVVALGTRFNVLGGYVGETEVMLDEGSVRLRNQEGVNLMRMQPNQKATVDKESGDVLIEELYVLPVVRLKYNVIALTDATAGEILEAIEKAYGTRVRTGNIQDPDKRYNFSCLKNRGIDEALAIFSHLTGAECKTIQ